MNVKFDRDGLVPAIVQDATTKQVLMVAYMNAEALRLTSQTGDAWFWSRSRQELWHKGSTSGNYQRVTNVMIDCDADTVLVEVNPDGPACHTGEVSCFFEKFEPTMLAAAAEHDERIDARVVEEVAAVIAQRNRDRPEGSYVAKLIASGIDRVAKKIGEEAGETIIAAKNADHDEIVWEVADLWFHSLVLLEASGVPVQDLWTELARRRH